MDSLVGLVSSRLHCGEPSVGSSRVTVNVSSRRDSYVDTALFLLSDVSSSFGADRAIGPAAVTA